MKTLSTIQVAKLVGVTPATLHRWIREKRIDAPPLQSLAGMEVRVWSEQEVERVKKHKSEHYWGKGGRKKRRKRSK
jgi:predicted DNA-binding transcriptional regulator AlpA